MRRSVVFVAVVAVAAGIGTLLGADRKLSTLAAQASELARPQSAPTALVMDSSDLETALQGLYEVSPAKARGFIPDATDAILNLPPLGFPAESDTNEGTSFFAPRAGATHTPQNFEFRHRNIRLFTQVNPSSTARSDPNRNGVIEISPLNPGTRIAIRVMGRIPAMSKENRVD